MQPPRRPPPRGGAPRGHPSRWKTLLLWLPPSFPLEERIKWVGRDCSSLHNRVSSFLTPMNRIHCQVACGKEAPLPSLSSLLMPQTPYRRLLAIQWTKMWFNLWKKSYGQVSHSISALAMNLENSSDFDHYSFVLLCLVGYDNSVESAIALFTPHWKTTWLPLIWVWLRKLVLGPETTWSRVADTDMFPTASTFQRVEEEERGRYYARCQWVEWQQQEMKKDPTPEESDPLLHRMLVETEDPPLYPTFPRDLVWRLRARLVCGTTGPPKTRPVDSDFETFHR